MVYFRLESAWAIATSHPFVFFLIVSVSAMLCFITLDKTDSGYFRVPGICFFAGFLLPAWIAILTGINIGDSEESRRLSGSEHWSRSEFFYAGLQLVPLAIMLLTTEILKHPKVQAILAQKDQVVLFPEGRKITLLTRRQFQCTMCCIPALWLIIAGLHKA